MLRKWRIAQKEARLALGPGYEDHDLVFCRPDGRPHHPESFSKTFDRKLRSAPFAELPTIGLHDLRHTWATLAQMSDVARTASFGMVRDQEPIRGFRFSSLQPGAEGFNETSQLRRTIHHLSYTSCNTASPDRVAPGATLRLLVPGRTGGPLWQGWPGRRRWCSSTGRRRCGPSPRSSTRWSKAGAGSTRPGV